MNKHLVCSAITAEDCKILDCKKFIKIQSELEELQTISKIGSWKIDLDSNKVECSKEIYKIFEIPFDIEMTYRSWFDYVVVNDRERLHDAFRYAVSTTATFDCEYRIETGLKNIKWLRGRADLSTRTGHYVFGTVQDITETKENEESLRRMSSVFLQSEEGSAITDVNGIILDINAAFTRVTGYSAEEVIGRNPRVLQSGKQDETFYKKMWNDILTLGVWSGEIWNKNKAGIIYPEHLKIFAIKDKNGEIINFISLFSDISEIKKYNEQMQYLAFHDVLTGLPNRTKLTEHITAALDYADRNKHMTVLAFLDLDGFKPVNDNHGHDVGDELLKRIASTINRNIRSNDMCARIGGDEFVILFSHVQDETEAHLALERIVSQIHKPHIINDQSIEVSASIGVTIYPNDKSNPDTLLRHADQAMYRAKQSGKNQIVYSLYFFRSVL